MSTLASAAEGTGGVKRGARGSSEKGVAEILEALEGRDPKEILTAIQVAEIAGVTQQTVFNWIKRKQNPLAATKPGREWQIRVKDLREFITNRSYREGEVRADGVDVRPQPEAGAADKTSPILLRLLPTAARDGGATTPEGGASNALPTPAEVLARLLDLAAISLQWRRAALTHDTAVRDGGEDWQAESADALKRLEADLLRACGMISDRGLSLFRFAAEDVIEALGGRSDEAEVEFSSEVKAEIFACRDARGDVGTVRRIFDALVEARRSCGEPTNELSFARFHRVVAEKAEELLRANAGCTRVLFSVTVDDGRARLRAKATGEVEDAPFDGLKEMLREALKLYEGLQSEQRATA